MNLEFVKLMFVKFRKVILAVLLLCLLPVGALVFSAYVTESSAVHLIEPVAVEHVSVTPVSVDLETVSESEVLPGPSIRGLRQTSGISTPPSRARTPYNRAWTTPSRARTHLPSPVPPASQSVFSPRREPEPLHIPLHHVQDTARYLAFDDNAARRADNYISTFSLDMNTASYANIRRFLNSGRLPPVDAVRIEEMINYFPALPEELQGKFLEGSPFYVGYEIAPSPWNEENKLLWLTVEARGIDFQDAPPANLVFLIDVSGSMNRPERLPLVQASLRLLTERLRPEDRVSIVSYAMSVDLVLPPTPGNYTARIINAIDSLRAGGGTAGGAAIQMAYQQALEAFIPGGINRILLCTDGDFNVGVSDIPSLTRMVSRYRDKGVTLSVFGFGTDNLNDALMVSIANAGNGNYSYIDSLLEAQKVLNEEMAATLVTVALGVRAQIEFNPAAVGEFRQIGYELRQLRREDFDNDRVSAGAIGAGARVTILYELTPRGRSFVTPLRYRSEPSETRDIQEHYRHLDEIAFLRLRWMEPGENVSSLAELPLLNSPAASFDEAGLGLRFSASVAAFGQKLRGNPELSATNWRDIADWAHNARGSDESGHRAELVRLISLAEGLDSSGRR